MVEMTGEAVEAVEAVEAPASAHAHHGLRFARSSTAPPRVVYHPEPYSC